MTLLGLLQVSSMTLLRCRCVLFVFHACVFSVGLLGALWGSSGRFLGGFWEASVADIYSLWWSI